MKNDMNFKASFEIGMTFDTAAITKGLQEVRKKMGEMTVNPSIFAGVDKEFLKLLNLLNTLKALQANITSTSGLNAYEKTLEKIKLSAGKISFEMQDIAKNLSSAFNTKEAIKLTSLLKVLEKDLKDASTNLENIKSKLNSAFLNLGFDLSGASQLVEQILLGQDAIQLLTKEFSNQTKMMEEYSDLLDEIGEKSKKISINVKDQILEPGYRDKEKTKLRTKAEAENITRGTISSIIVDDYKNGIEDVEIITAHIEASLKSQGIELYENSKILESVKRKYQELLDELQLVEDNLSKSVQLTESLSTSMEQFLTNNTSSVSEINNLANDLTTASGAADTLETKINDTTTAINNIDNSDKLDLLSNDTKEATKNMNELVSKELNLVEEQKQSNMMQTAINATFDRAGNVIKNILSIGNAYRYLNQIVRQTFQDVEKLDTAFASIAMVTNYSVSELWDLYSQYSEIANRLGQTTEGAIKSSALYYQLG